MSIAIANQRLAPTSVSLTDENPTIETPDTGRRATNSRSSLLAINPGSPGEGRVEPRLPNGVSELDRKVRNAVPVLPEPGRLLAPQLPPVLLKQLGGNERVWHGVEPTTRLTDKAVLGEVLRFMRDTGLAAGLPTDWSGTQRDHFASMLVARALQTQENGSSVTRLRADLTEIYASVDRESRRLPYRPSASLNVAPDTRPLALPPPVTSRSNPTPSPGERLDRRIVRGDIADAIASVDPQVSRRAYVEAIRLVGQLPPQDQPAVRVNLDNQYLAYAGEREQATQRGVQRTLFREIAGAYQQLPAESQARVHPLGAAVIAAGQDLASLSVAREMLRFDTNTPPMLTSLQVPLGTGTISVDRATIGALCTRAEQTLQAARQRWAQALQTPLAAATVPAASSEVPPSASTAGSGLATPPKTVPPPADGFELRYPSPDKAKVDAFLRDKTGLGIEQLQALGQPGNASRDVDPIDLVLRGLGNRPSAPGTPLVIEDTYHGHKAVLSIDAAGKLTVDLNTGIKVTSNIKGVARLDEGPLRNPQVFDSPMLHDKSLNFYVTALPLLPLPGMRVPLPAGLGSTELKVLFSFPLGPGGASDLRNPLAGLKLLNDIRLSRAELLKQGAYLSDLDPVKLAISELNRIGDTRVVANAFLPLNWADFALPRLGRNEQRVYIPNTYRAIEVQRGLTIDKAGHIALNVDRQADGTYRLKPGTLLSLNLRDNQDARMPWGPQYLLGGVAASLGGPGAALAATTASQFALSLLAGTDGAASVTSTGHNFTLTPQDVIPAAVVESLDKAFNQPNVFKQFKDAPIGTVVHKYAKDRPVLFARFEAENPGHLGGFKVPRLKPDGTLAAANEPGTASLLEFWKVTEQRRPDREVLDLQARTNATVSLGATSNADPTLKLAPRSPDNVSRIWRAFPFTVLYLDLRGGGVNILDGQKRLALLGDPRSASGAQLERPGVGQGARVLANESWFQRDVASLRQGLLGGRPEARTEPRPLALGIDLGVAERMRALLAGLPADSPLFTRRQIDLGLEAPPAASGSTTLDAAHPGLFRGEPVTAESHAAVRDHLAGIRQSLPPDRQSAFGAIEQSILAGIAVGRPADLRALETLDSVRLTIETANPASPLRGEAAKSLVERGAIATLETQRRAEWQGVLSEPYRARVPQWEAIITSVTGGVLPPATGSYAQEIKKFLQEQSPGNLTGYYLRMTTAQTSPRDPVRPPDRPEREALVDADELHFILENEVKPRDREQVIEQSGLSKYVYVAPAAEGYKFNFRPPQIEQRFGPPPEALDAYALAPSPGVDWVPEPKPIERRVGFGDVRTGEIVGVDLANRALVLGPPASQDRFVSHHDLVPHTTAPDAFSNQPSEQLPGRVVEFQGARFRIEKVEAQSDPHGITLRPLDAAGNPVAAAKPVFVPLYQLPEISAVIEGRVHHPVGISWTLVQFQPEIATETLKLQPGMSFEAFVDDPARGARASSGPVTLKVADGGELRVTASTNPTIRVGESFGLDKLVPTITTERSQHSTGEHIPNADGIVSAGSPVKIRTSRALAGLNRSSSAEGSLGMNADAKVTHVMSQQSWDDVAKFINAYRSKKAPEALVMQNVVYELVSETDNFKTARPILEALSNFHKRFPQTQILLYTANANVAFKLSFKVGTNSMMLREFERAGIETRSRPPSGRPQTTHAKSVSIVGADGEPTASKLVTSGFEPRPRGKGDFHLDLNPRDSALLATYVRIDALPDSVPDLATRQSLLQSLQARYPDLGLTFENMKTQSGLSQARARITADLAKDGVLVQDPTGGRGYLQAGYRKLIEGNAPGDDLVIAQLRELRMPSLTQMLIDEAAKGKTVFVQASMFDARSYEMLESASQRMPNLRFERIGGPNDPPDYAHYNAIITKQGMVIGSGYFWSSMMNPLDRQPSTEGGILLQGGSKPYVEALESVFKYQREAGSAGFDQRMRDALLPSPPQAPSGDTRR